MEVCKSKPPLFQIRKTQAAACYLHSKLAKVGPENLSELLPV